MTQHAPEGATMTTTVPAETVRRLSNSLLGLAAVAASRNELQQVLGA